jgi:hypothetical protein
VTLHAERDELPAVPLYVELCHWSDVELEEFGDLRECNSL